MKDIWIAPNFTVVDIRECNIGLYLSECPEDISLDSQIDDPWFVAE